MMEHPGGEDMVTQARELHHAADARDDSGIRWLASECRNNNVRIESLVRQAEEARDPELAAFFRRTFAASRRLASA
jgi:hypothetical protein